MKKTLWQRNFTLVTVASTLGAIGGIASSFALSILVFDEMQSTLASALVLAIQMIPYFIIPLIAAPLMDRLPRKPFLVGGDIINGGLYVLAGIYLMNMEFSYIAYLMFSLVLASISSFDELAYNSMYPKLIPEGMEQKGYAVSSSLYPVLKVIMMPISATLITSLGVANLLLIQGGLSIAAALVESQIRIKEEKRMDEGGFSFKIWLGDIKEAIKYMKDEKGVRSIFSYMAVTNGIASGYSPILVAFFRTMPGFGIARYAFFSVAEFLGRTLGGAVQYRVEIPKKKKYGFAFMVYNVYETMDMSLLWLPYPLMLVNRGICGFLGTNSATMRQAAVQTYIPDELRARINAFSSMMVMGACSVLSLFVGALGEVFDYRICMTVCAGITLVYCWLTIWRDRAHVRKVYERETEVPSEQEKPEPELEPEPEVT